MLNIQQARYHVCQTLLRDIHPLQSLLLPEQIESLSHFQKDKSENISQLILKKMLKIVSIEFL